MVEPEQSDNKDNKEKDSDSIQEAEQPDKHNLHHNTAKYTRYLKKIRSRLWKFIGDGDNKTHFSNLVSLFMMLVTIALVGYTLGLLNSSNNQVKKAKESVKIAGDALAETKRYNSKSLEIQRKILDTTVYSNQKTLTQNKIYNQHSLAKQEAALKEVQKEFEKQNEPYLYVSDIDSVHVIIDHAYFMFKLYNLGNRPVKVITENVKIQWVVAKDTAIMNKNPFIYLNKSANVSNYVYTKEAAEFYDIKSSKVSFPYPNDNAVNSFKDGNLLVFFIGKIGYINYTNDKKRMFEFVVKLIYNTNGNIGYDYKRVDNYDVK